MEPLPNMFWTTLNDCIVGNRSSSGIPKFKRMTDHDHAAICTTGYWCFSYKPSFMVPENT